MSNTRTDDLQYHRSWLERELFRWGRKSYAARPKVDYPVFTESSATYVIRVSSHKDVPLVHRIKVALGGVMRELHNGYDIVTGWGYWDGVHEPSVTVTIQATPTVLSAALDALATVRGIRWAHVERHKIPTAYVDLYERAGR
jgi:hypothetical protein